MLGEVPPEHAHHRDLSGREFAILAPVIALLVVFGLQPNLLLDRIDPTTESVVSNLECERREQLLEVESGECRSVLPEATEAAPAVAASPGPEAMP
jgi:hypothetical protein